MRVILITFYTITIFLRLISYLYTCSCLEYSNISHLTNRNTVQNGTVYSAYQKQLHYSNGPITSPLKYFRKVSTHDALCRILCSHLHKEMSFWKHLVNIVVWEQTIVTRANAKTRKSFQATSRGRQCRFPLESEENFVRVMCKVAQLPLLDDDLLCMVLNQNDTVFFKWLNWKVLTTKLIGSTHKSTQI